MPAQAGVENPAISHVSFSGIIKRIPNLDDAFQTPNFISADRSDCPCVLRVTFFPSGLSSAEPLSPRSIVLTWLLYSQEESWAVEKTLTNETWMCHIECDYWQPFFRSLILLHCWNMGHSLRLSNSSFCGSPSAAVQCLWVGFWESQQT